VLSLRRFIRSRNVLTEGKEIQDMKRGDVSRSRAASPRHGVVTPRRAFLKGIAVGGTGLVAHGAGLAPRIAWGQGKEVLLWTFLNPTANHPRSVVQQNLVQRAEKQHGIKVNVELVPWQTMNQQLIQATAAGRGPDVVFAPGDWMTQDVKAGAVAPVTEFVRRWPESTVKDFVPSLDFFSWDGEVYALPFLNFFTLLAYRKDWYKEKNLKEPANWDELGRNARALTSDKRSGAVIALTPSENAAILMKAFIPMLVGAGGNLFDASGKAAFNSTAGAKVIQFWYDLVYDYKAVPLSCLTMNAETQTQALRGSIAAMAFEGNHRIPTARLGEGVGANLGGMPIPGPTGGRCPAYIANTVVLMGKNVKNRDASWKLMEEFVSTQSILEDASLAGQMPTRKSVLNAPFFASEAGRELREWGRYMVENPYTFKWPLTFPVLSVILANAVQDIIGRKAPIKDRLEQAATEWNREMA
jgi:ABC-type glycerol-3-phosphate transport system substrate-binding protein